jgi:hypothetical protein
MKRSVILFAFVLSFASIGLPQEPTQITQQELVRRTQEMMDALVPGNKRPWEKYFADDAIYSDEKGRVMNKKELVEDIAPLPKGYSGTIKVVNAQSRIIGDTAVLSYDSDETEAIFGQELHARYHTVDTWMRRNSKWQVIATQAHRYYEDPSAGEIDPKRLDTYVGTYELGPGVQAVVSREGDRLFHQRTGRPRMELFPEASDIFFRKGVEGRILFLAGQNGKADTLIDRRNNEDVRWKRVK